MAPVLPGAEPFSARGGRAGVLLLHGFTGCPQSLRPLAAAFAAAGHTVELPLLPGHGTSPDDMAATSWDDWSAAALAAYDELAERCDSVAVAGLSMGGALAALVAVERPAVAGLVLVNPAVEPPAPEVRDSIAAMLDSGTTMLPAIGNDVADPDTEELAYDQMPVAALVSLFDGQAKLAPRLSEIRCPALLFTSRQDHIVPNSASDLLVAKAGGRVEQVMLERSYHVATIDLDHTEIEQRAVAFLASL